MRFVNVIAYDRPFLFFLTTEGFGSCKGEDNGGHAVLGIDEMGNVLNINKLVEKVMLKAPADRT
jgi:hypothetical protein